MLRGEVGLRLREVLRMIAAEHDMVVVQGNIRPNHVHILVSAPTYRSPAKMLQYLKSKRTDRAPSRFGTSHRRRRNELQADSSVIRTDLSLNGRLRP